MKNVVIIICIGITSLTACKRIADKMFSPVVKTLLQPIFNPDLLDLRRDFITYRRIHNQEWPVDVNQFKKFIFQEQTGLRLEKFNKLDWTFVEDTVKINFVLQYDVSYKTEYDLLEGDMKIYMLNDSSAISDVIVTKYK